jgi:hypothetical protein
MANSPVLPFFAHNNTVKAWCVTGNHIITATTQADFDARNFVDGYNLRLDYATQTSMASGGGAGALKFSFITPMSDTKYKVMVQAYGWTSPLYPQFAHVLNSALYPKTTTSFWVRVGFMCNSASTAPFSGSGRTSNQVHNIVLWSNAVSSLGVVVI